METNKDLSLAEIEELQPKLEESYKFVSQYLKKNPISDLEEEFNDISEFASYQRDEAPDHPYYQYAFTDLKAIERFIEKHKEFVVNLSFLSKYKGYYYQDFNISFTLKLLSKIVNSELAVPFARIGIL